MLLKNTSSQAIVASPKSNSTYRMQHSLEATVPNPKAKVSSRIPKGKEKATAVRRNFRSERARLVDSV